jgi:hypothetical protein
MPYITGQYMPTLGVLAGALFIRAFAIWLMTQCVDTSKSPDKSNKNEVETQVGGNNLNLSNIVLTYLITHLIGYAVMRSPQIISEIGSQIHRCIIVGLML